MTVSVMKKTHTDPLSGLYQLDEDKHLQEHEALMVVANMLDDIEKIDILRDTLRGLMVTDEVLGMRILTMLDDLIQGIRKEQMERANRAWRLRFSNLFNFVR